MTLSGQAPEPIGPLASFMNLANTEHFMTGLRKGANLRLVRKELQSLWESESRTRKERYVHKI